MLYGSFERAFADYESGFDKEEVRSMLLRRGYDSRLSFYVVDNGYLILVKRVSADRVVPALTKMVN